MERGENDIAEFMFSKRKMEKRPHYCAMFLNQ